MVEPEALANLKIDRRLAPYEEHAYGSCWGSGEMSLQSAPFIAEHQKNSSIELSKYGVGIRGDELCSGRIYP